MTACGITISIEFWELAQFSLAAPIVLGVCSFALVLGKFILVHWITTSKSVCSSLPPSNFVAKRSFSQTERDARVDEYIYTISQIFLFAGSIIAACPYLCVCVCVLSLPHENYVKVYTDEYLIIFRYFREPFQSNCAW